MYKQAIVLSNVSRAWNSTRNTLGNGSNDGGITAVAIVVEAGALVNTRPRERSLRVNSVDVYHPRNVASVTEEPRRRVQNVRLGIDPAVLGKAAAANRWKEKDNGQMLPRLAKHCSTYTIHRFMAPASSESRETHKCTRCCYDYEAIKRMTNQHCDGSRRVKVPAGNDTRI